MMHSLFSVAVFLILSVAPGPSLQEIVLWPQPMCMPPKCDNACPHGYDIGDWGCPTCDCTPPPEPLMPMCALPKCDNACPHGYDIGEWGCPTCDCTPPPEPLMPMCALPKCENACPHGYAIGDMGCPTCDCNPPPVCDLACDRLHYLDFENCRCVSVDLPIIKEPPKPKCSKALCKMWCPYGNVLDDQGCPICACQGLPANPCEQPIGQTGVMGGPGCKPKSTVWGFDKKKGRCVQFEYGGCHGNDNRFKSKRKCKRACIGLKKPSFVQA